MFDDSLRAALSLEEIREMVTSLGFWVIWFRQQVTDTGPGRIGGKITKSAGTSDSDF